jgi:hypothetical protein
MGKPEREVYEIISEYLSGFCICYNRHIVLNDVRHV